MAEREQRVTPLELFFDLVFLYALTHVTQLMSHDATWPGVGGGLLVLAALWWAWSGHAWLTNALEPEAGAVRAGMFGAMAAMLLVALAVPGVFGAEAVLFGVAYVFVRLFNLVLDAIAAGRNPDLRGTLGRFAPTATLASVLIPALLRSSRSRPHAFVPRRVRRPPRRAPARPARRRPGRRGRARSGPVEPDGRAPS
jgi:low temperature requirement protein LtrA